jgi:transposase
MVRNSTRPDASIIAATLAASRSLDEAASRLNVHRTTLWRWLRALEKEGTPIQVGRRIFIEEEAA